MIFLILLLLLAFECLIFLLEQFLICSTLDFFNESLLEFGLHRLLLDAKGFFGILNRRAVSVLEVVQWLLDWLVLRIHVAMNKVNQVVQERWFRIQENQEFLAEFSNVAIIESLNLLEGEVKWLDVLRKVAVIHEPLVKLLEKLCESVSWLGTTLLEVQTS